MASKDTFTAEVPKRILETDEYKDWKDQLDGSQDTKIEAAREKIESEGVVTSAKSLGDGLHEKKWASGLRLYFAIVKDENGQAALLVLGSGKGREQDKAIKNSKKFLKKYTVYQGSIEKKD